MRVLVVGGTGLLGHHVVTELAAGGHRVTVLARSVRSVPPGVTLVTGDTLLLDEADWYGLLTGQDGVVFAAGEDDRVAPPRPALPHFRAANVTPVRRMLAAAGRAGCRAAVVHGSYFTAIARDRPQLELERRHPYVRSRVEQAALGPAMAGELAVAVLEIPFVFGSAPGRLPLWAPVVPWLRSGAPLLAPPGGTAVVTAANVARATVNALVSQASGSFPVAEENLTWTQLLTRFAVAAGRRGPVRVRRLPPVVLGLVLRAFGRWHRLHGREGGLDSRWLSQLLTARLYLDTGDVRATLGVVAGGLDAALRETVTASVGAGADP